MTMKLASPVELFETSDSSSLQEVAPVLKWAGGKGQLLPVLKEHLPKKLEQGLLDRYLEPFIGGGALFFELMRLYPHLKAYLFDVNRELIILYKVLKHDVDGLVNALADLATNYLHKDEEGRKQVYYDARDKYNANIQSITIDSYKPTWVDRAALTVFLNKTCFNGLYRVNSKGLYNVPAGRYKNPKILNEKRLRGAAEVLKRAEVIHGDFTQAAKFVTKQSFIYYDPPYRPISKTSCFKDYSGKFDDDDQRRLSRFVAEMDKKGAHQLLSNSDPTNTDPDDGFFDDLYHPYIIKRIEANRKINSKASKRGAVRELLIRNYID